MCFSATHGTGINFGNLATFVTSFELVTGTGEVHFNVDNMYNDCLDIQAKLITRNIYGTIISNTVLVQFSRHVNFVVFTDNLSAKIIFLNFC